MAEFDVDLVPIHLFELDDAYLFKHYFERQDLFAELRAYYDDGEYRFEVPQDDFEDVRAVLESNHYEPIVVEDVEAFSVVKEQYTEHADILRNAVMHWTRDGYYFFVMKDRLAVEQAVEQGATRLEETELVLGV